MSLDYAAGLSHYDDLGVCNLDEVFDTAEALEEKVSKLAGLLRDHKGACVHVGAGLSTSAGIRDFRGKGGVWSEMLEARASSSSKPKHEASQGASTSSSGRQQNKLEEQMTKSDEDKSRETKPFDETEPTAGHLALKVLCQEGFVSHIVSQNVDGLFLKANLERKFISELHGNFYLDECTKCRARFIRSTASQSMRLQRLGNLRCLRNKGSSELICKGFLRDTILDWESPVPYNELRTAERFSKKCHLHITIGTSLQLRPSKDLIRNSGKLVVINLQPTHMDSNADLVINGYSDDVLLQLIKELKLTMEPYSVDNDPTKNTDLIGTMWRK